MKLIIDCNVLIAAGLKDGLCREVFIQSVKVGEIFLSQEILLEYLLVTRREKFMGFKKNLEQLIELVSQVAILIEPQQSTFKLPDPNDKKYIDLAVSAGANFLITGNLVDFPETKYGVTEVLFPRNFSDILTKSDQRLIK